MGEKPLPSKGEVGVGAIEQHRSISKAPTPGPSLGREGGIRATLTAAAARLAAVSDTPRLDAELLMAYALSIEREALLLDPSRFAVPASFAPLLARRLTHEPIAYVLGHRDFWTIRLSVGPGVLIPRADSETLIEAAIGHFGASGPATILDLGTGPGTLLLAALDQWPQAIGLGIDASQDALSYATRNAEQLGLAGRATFALGDWTGHPPADLILCNPPYIEAGDTLDPQVADHEPHEALFAGSDGLDDYRRIIPALAAQLTSNGIAILEIGASQSAAVTTLAEAEGFAVDCKRDIAGRDRALILRPSNAAA